MTSLLPKRILLIVLALLAVFGGATLARAQLGESKSNAPAKLPAVNIRGLMVNGANGANRELLPCTVIKPSSAVYTGDSNTEWVEFTLKTTSNVKSIMLDNTSGISSASRYMVYVGDKTNAEMKAGESKYGDTQKETIQIPLSNSTKNISMVRVHSMGGSNQRDMLEQALICSGDSRAESGSTSASITNNTSLAAPTIIATCPGGDLYLSKTELRVGDTITAIAPPMWYDGSYKSSNSEVISIEGNVVRAVAPGTAEVYGADLRGSNERGCRTNGIVVTVTPLGEVK